MLLSFFCPSRKLVSSAVTAVAMIGMWMIWIGVLPALSMIGNYPLWGKANEVAVASAPAPEVSSETVIGGSTPAAPDVASTASSDTLIRSVTMSDLALAILIMFVTVILEVRDVGQYEKYFLVVLLKLPRDSCSSLPAAALGTDLLKEL